MNLEKQITSVEVAEMIGKDHKNILRDIRTYELELAELNIEPSVFFKVSTYRDPNNQVRPSRLITKKGCEFIGNKLTGIKGTEFTARYIIKFGEMEEKIAFTPLTKKEEMRLYIEALEEQDAKIEKVNNDLQEFKQDMPLLALECSRITNSKNKVVVTLLGGKQSTSYKDNSIRGQVYRDLEKQLKREFGVDTYKAIKRNQCDIAVQIINSYKLPMFLDNLVTDTNSQISFA